MVELNLYRFNFKQKIDVMNFDIKDLNESIEIEIRDYRRMLWSCKSDFETVLNHYVKFLNDNKSMLDKLENENDLQIEFARRDGRHAIAFLPTECSIDIVGSGTFLYRVKSTLEVALAYYRLYRGENWIDLERYDKDRELEINFNLF